MATCEHCGGDGAKNVGDMVVCARCVDTWFCQNFVGPMPFDQLDYTPSHGNVAMRGVDKEWNMEVPIEQGRAMEADGIPVYWIAPDSELAKMEV